MSSVDGWITAYGLGYLTIENCNAVSIRHSVLGLGHGFTPASPVRNGVYLSNSNIVVDNCGLYGASGEWGSGGGICQTCCTDGGAGTTALTLRDGSSARVQSSTLQGGLGGPGFGVFCSTGDHAAAIHLDATSAATTVATTLLAPLDSLNVLELQGPPRVFQMPASVQGGSPFVTRAVAPRGDTVFVLVGTELAHADLGPVAGVLQVTQSPGRRRLGSIPQGGAALYTFLAPDIAPGTVHSVPIQSAFLDATGQIRFAPADYIEFRGPGVPAW